MEFVHSHENAHSHTGNRFRYERSPKCCLLRIALASIPSLPGHVKSDLAAAAAAAIRLCAVDMRCVVSNYIHDAPLHRYLFAYKRLFYIVGKQKITLVDFHYNPLAALASGKL